MRTILDHLQKPFLPFGGSVRIVSLVPSITELLVDMGLTDNMVGRTKFCIYPAHIKRIIPACGGTKNPNRSKILGIKPDIIIMNLEENNKEDAHFFEDNGIPVFVTSIRNRADNIALIRSMEGLFNRDHEAQSIIDQIEWNSEKFVPSKKGKAIYLIWKDPYMTVGGDTFIHDMMNWAGYENIYSTDLRYPIVQNTDMGTDINWILLSSEPYPFAEKHILQVAQDFGVPTEKIKLVDGTYFSWYGSRIIHSAAYFNAI